MTFAEFLEIDCVVGCDIEFPWNVQNASIITYKFDDIILLINKSLMVLEVFNEGNLQTLRILKMDAGIFPRSCDVWLDWDHAMCWHSVHVWFQVEYLKDRSDWTPDSLFFFDLVHYFDLGLSKDSRVAFPVSKTSTLPWPLFQCWLGSSPSKSEQNWIRGSVFLLVIVACYSGSMN